MPEVQKQSPLHLRRRQDCENNDPERILQKWRKLRALQTKEEGDCRVVSIALLSYVDPEIEKCDLGRPCETCVNAKKTDLCKYHKPKSPERPNHLRWIEPARKRRVSPSSSDTEIFESSPGSSTSTLWKSSPPPVPPVYFDLIDPSYVLHLNDLLRNMRLSETSLAMSKVSLADLELNLCVVSYRSIPVSHFALAASLSLHTARNVASGSRSPNNTHFS